MVKMLSASFYVVCIVFLSSFSIDELLFKFSFSVSPSSSLVVNACYIWGTDSGECTTNTLDGVWKSAFMPYCADRVVYPACIPKVQQLPPSREFPDGRWTNYSVLSKDTWIGEVAEKHIQARISLETNVTLRAKVQNEYGDKGKIVRRFSRRPDCVEAFRKLFCYINFPRCDMERDLTLPTCRSACENFFKACVYPHDLWRCGQSKYFNGYFPEPPAVSKDGNLTYLRDYFPGQPWRKNKFNKHGSELPICTPSVRGAASQQFSTSRVGLFLLTLISFVVALLY
jgi:hypothetical protein